MTTAVLAPVAKDGADRLGRRRFRKKLLNKEKITYGGQTVDFNSEYMADLVKSFSEVAYDQVPFVLADDMNRHNELPERFRGELDSLELADDGLYGIIATNKEGAKILTDNPKLGVSARIIEGLGKADGRVFKRAIRHVLGTMDPRISNLGPWQPIDLSDEVGDTEVETVDLSAASFTEGKTMAKATTKTKRAKRRSMKGREIDLASLSDEQFQSLLDMSSPVEDEEDEETDEDGNPLVELDENGDPVEPEDEGDNEGDDDEGDDEEEDNKPPKSRKKKTKKTTETTETDLSNSALSAETRDQVATMRIDLAAERFGTYRENLVAEGVPPFMLDLAAPILSSPDNVVLDLSNSDEDVDARKVITDMLDGMKGMIDLSAPLGHQVDLSEETDEEKALLSEWDTRFGNA